MIDTMAVKSGSHSLMNQGMDDHATVLTGYPLIL